MNLNLIKEIKNLKGKRILVRTDFNVPLKGSKIIDDYKIRAALPTLKYLLEKDAVVIIMSHLGRPKGRVVKELGLQPVAKHLEKLLRRKILFLPSRKIEKCKSKIHKNVQAKLFIIENLRFWQGEESNSTVFAKQLAAFADIYVNDAFAVCHRNHASVSAITQYLPSCAGLLLEQEFEHLKAILTRPQRPLLGIMGGVKISTKLPVTKQLLKKVDLLVVGGALANNFIKACGWEVGRSVIEKKYVPEARKLLCNKKLGKKIIIPVDVKIGNSLEAPRKAVWRSVDEVKEDEYILDIGLRTRRLYTQFIKHSKSVIWNGPLGLFENKRFRKGTRAVIRALKKNKRAHIVIGGGDTLFAVGRRLLSHRHNVFLSTGGGAMLAFLGEGELPGLEPLVKR